jgi:hypothetical protein
MTRQRGDGRPAQQRANAGSGRASQGKSPNEGEGSRSAARDYNERNARFIREGKVDKSAEEAKRAVESGERKELEEAERVGREHRRS